MRARLIASAAVAAVLAAVLAGCNFVTPQATLQHYDPSDGVSTVVGDVHILNALVLSEDGENGNLLFSAVNDSGDTVELTAQYASDGDKTDLSFEVPASTNAAFGFGDGGQVYLESIDAKPGSLVAIYFHYGSEEGRELLVPVLDGSLEQYQPYLPVTPTPVPTETGAPTPNPTETPGG